MSVELEWSAAMAALPGESESGDHYVARRVGARTLFGVIDGLGHGSEAAIASRTAADTLDRFASDSLPNLLEHCHRTLRPTRGATISLGVIDDHDATLTWLGVGNVEGNVLRAERGVPNEKLLLRSGVVGSHLPTLYTATLTLHNRDLVIFTSDGIASDFTEVLNTEGTSQTIAERILANSNRGTDDALVLVVRYGR